MLQNPFCDSEEIDDEMQLLPELEPGDDGNGMYEHFRFVAEKGQTLLRVDKFLVARMEK